MGGADGDAVELGCHVARTGADEEAVGELWFLTPFSVRVPGRRGCLGDSGRAGEITARGWAGEKAGLFEHPALGIPVIPGSGLILGGLLDTCLEVEDTPRKSGIKA